MKEERRGRDCSIIPHTCEKQRDLTSPSEKWRHDRETCNSFIETCFRLFLSFLCILTLITIALAISFTIKCRLFARKEWLAKRNKATLISIWGQGRAISADIGRTFFPFRLVWWALRSSVTQIFSNGLPSHDKLWYLYLVGIQ
jgi:hypothetical protein